MAEKTLGTLFHEDLRDIGHAGAGTARALPRMARAAGFEGSCFEGSWRAEALGGEARQEGRREVARTDIGDEGRRRPGRTRRCGRASRSGFGVREAVMVLDPDVPMPAEPPPGPDLPPFPDPHPDPDRPEPADPIPPDGPQPDPPPVHSQGRPPCSMPALSLAGDGAGMGRDGADAGRTRRSISTAVRPGGRVAGRTSPVGPRAEGGPVQRMRAAA